MKRLTLAMFAILILLMASVQGTVVAQSIDVEIRDGWAEEVFPPGDEWQLDFEAKSTVVKGDPPAGSSYNTTYALEVQYDDPMTGPTWKLLDTHTRIPPTSLGFGWTAWVVLKGAMPQTTLEPLTDAMTGEEYYNIRLTGTYACSTFTPGDPPTIVSHWIHVDVSDTIRCTIEEVPQPSAPEEAPEPRTPNHSWYTTTFGLFSRRSAAFVLVS